MSAAADLAARASLILELAWLAAAALGRSGASAAMRHLAWQLGFVALLALPPLAAAMPALPVLPAAVGEASAEPGAAAAVPAVPLALLAYAAVAAMLAIRHLAVRLLLARAWRAARPADPGREALVHGLAAELGVRSRVSLRLGAGTAMPMTWGTLAPKLLLPAAAAAWPTERLRRVLLHELAHVRRRDSLIRSVAALACALYWFHPAVWLAARRLRLEQELAADDLVLAAGAPARGYARDLLALAATLGRSRSTAAAPAMAGSQLERRIAALVGAPNRRCATLAFAAPAWAMALAATLLIAAAVPVVGTAERDAEPPVLAAPSVAAAEPVAARQPHRARKRPKALPSEPGRPSVARSDAAMAPLPAIPAIPPVQAIPAVPVIAAVPAIPAVPATPPR